MTDQQIIDQAHDLITQPAPPLPEKHTLLDAYYSVKAHKDRGLDFLKEHGERLLILAPKFHASLESWKHTAI